MAGRCTACLTGGVEAPALPGGALCAAHAAAATGAVAAATGADAAAQTADDVMDEDLEEPGTGLTQAAAGLTVLDPLAAPSSADTASAGVSSPDPLRDTLFREWAHQEVNDVHFELINAMVLSDPSINDLPIALPTNLDALKIIYKKWPTLSAPRARGCTLASPALRAPPPRSS